MPVVPALIPDLVLPSLLGKGAEGEGSPPHLPLFHRASRLIGHAHFLPNQQRRLRHHARPSRLPQRLSRNQQQPLHHRAPLSFCQHRSSRNRVERPI